MNASLEIKRAPLVSSSFEFKFAGSSTPGSFSGYGSVAGNVDSHLDVIEKGAFKASLQEWERRGRLPPMLLQHGGMNISVDDMIPIGKWLSMEEDSKGLKVDGQLFAMQTDRAQLIYEGMKAGSLDGLSIGYRVKRSTSGTKPSEPRRRIHEIDLREVSLVTFPSNDAARVSSVKSEIYPDEIKTVHDFDRMLASLGFPRKFARRASEAVAAAGLFTTSKKSDRSAIAVKLLAAAKNLSEKD